MLEHESFFKFLLGSPFNNQACLSSRHGKCCIIPVLSSGDVWQ